MPLHGVLPLKQRRDKGHIKMSFSAVAGLHTGAHVTRMLTGLIDDRQPVGTEPQTTGHQPEWCKAQVDHRRSDAA